MKFLTLTLVYFFIISSCSKNIDTKILKNDVFIKDIGTYYLKKNKLVIKEFKNGSLIYGIGTKLNKPIYEHSLFSPFSKNQYWTIYIDSSENIWFYTSDLQMLTILIKDKYSNNYNVYDKTQQNIELPKKFIDELSKHNLNLNDLIENINKNS